MLVAVADLEKVLLDQPLLAFYRLLAPPAPGDVRRAAALLRGRGQLREQLEAAAKRDLYETTEGPTMVLIE